jgi:hypothetical protein
MNKRLKMLGFEDKSKKQIASQSLSTKNPKNELLKIYKLEQGIHDNLRKIIHLDE